MSAHLINECRRQVDDDEDGHKLLVVVVVAVCPNVHNSHRTDLYY